MVAAVKEKPITGSNASKLSRLVDNMRSEAPESPYDGEKHKQAVLGPKERNIAIKALRRSDENL